MFESTALVEASSLSTADESHCVVLSLMSFERLMLFFRSSMRPFGLFALTRRGLRIREGVFAIGAADELAHWSR